MAQTLASNGLQCGSAWPSLKPSFQRRGPACAGSSRTRVLPSALAPRSPAPSSASPAATVTAAATVSAAVTETASSSAGAASQQSAAAKGDTSTGSIWGTGPAPRSARGSGDSSSDTSSRRAFGIQDMLLSALASSGPAPFGPMFTPPLVAGALSGGMVVDGPALGASATASATWQPRRHLSTTAAALPTLRVPARSAPSHTSSRGTGSSTEHQHRESQPITIATTTTTTTTTAGTESTAAAMPVSRKAAGAAAVQAVRAGGAMAGAAPDIHIHGGWLGVARQVAAGLSTLSLVSAMSATVVCGAIKAAAAMSGPAVVYVAASGAAASASSAASSAAVTLHVFGAPPAYAVAAAVAGLLLGLVVGAVDAVWARRISISSSNRSSSGGLGGWSVAA